MKVAARQPQQDCWEGTEGRAEASQDSARGQAALEEQDGCSEQSHPVQLCFFCAFLCFFLGPSGQPCPMLLQLPRIPQPQLPSGSQPCPVSAAPGIVFELFRLFPLN